MKTRTEIRYEGDEAKELVLAATGRPFLLLVEDEDGGILLKNNGFRLQTVVEMVKTMAEADSRFRRQLPDILIEISKCISDGEKG